MIEKFKGKIKLLSIYNLLCWKFWCLLKKLQLHARLTCLTPDATVKLPTDFTWM